MPARVVRAALAFAALAAARPVPAATPDQIDGAVRTGAEFLRGQFATPAEAAQRGGSYGTGPAALAGLALLEAGTPPAAPAVQVIAKAVRAAAYRENQTYRVSLALLFLDRLGDPADVPLIQLLGVRLLAGQSGNGGWTYSTGDEVNDAREKELRAGFQQATLTTAPPKPADGKAPPPPPGPRLHTEVERHYRGLLVTVRRPQTDDNSNTQFAIVALWVARRHAVPADTAFAAVEARFLLGQAQEGGWGYNFRDRTAGPSMTCAGLLGLATALARREEQVLTNRPAPKPTAKAPEDPTFTPPKPKADPKAGRVLDPREVAIARGFDRLGAFLAGDGNPAGPPQIFNPNPRAHGDHDLYFLWSVERVGVIFDRKLIGGVDWYEAAADALVKGQRADGAWAAGYTPEVNTAFAVLVLRRSNLARDLVAKRGGDAELRATAPRPAGPQSPAAADPEKLAVALLAAAAGAWADELARVRDGKGAEYTRVLAVAAAAAVDDSRRKDVRGALAERLTRMTADTLRALLADPDAELRRAACLACGMKDDREFVPDLIDRVADADDGVSRAAKASLKSLTGQDHGPPAGATADQKRAAAGAWKLWFTTLPK